MSNYSQILLNKSSEYNGGMDQAQFYIKLFKQFKEDEDYPMRSEYENRFINLLNHYINLFDRNNILPKIVYETFEDIKNCIIDNHMLTPNLETFLWCRIAICFQKYILDMEKFEYLFNYNSASLSNLPTYNNVKDFLIDVPKYHFYDDYYDLENDKSYPLGGFIDYAKNYSEKYTNLYPIINKSGYYGINTCVLSYFNDIQPLVITFFFKSEKNSAIDHFNHDIGHAETISDYYLPLKDVYYDALENQENIEILKLLIIVIFIAFHESMDTYNYECNEEMFDIFKKLKILKKYRDELSIIDESSSRYFCRKRNETLYEKYIKDMVINNCIFEIYQSGKFNRKYFEETFKKLNKFIDDKDPILEHLTDLKNLQDTNDPYLIYAFNRIYHKDSEYRFWKSSDDQIIRYEDFIIENFEIINKYGLDDWYNNRKIYAEKSLKENREGINNIPKNVEDTKNNYEISCDEYFLAIWIICNVYPETIPYFEQFIPDLLENPKLVFEVKW